MKTKKFQKKLTLNKKTVADLNSGEVKGIQGGKPWESIFLTVCKLTVCCPTIYPCETVHVGETCCPLGNSC